MFEFISKTVSSKKFSIFSASNNNSNAADICKYPKADKSKHVIAAIAIKVHILIVA